MYSRWCERFSSRGQRIVVAALIVIALAGTVSAAGGDGELGFAKQCYGSLNVTSTPTGAAVSIDGVNAGSTPFVRSRVPMGPHSIRVSSPMHVDATETL